MQRLLGVAGCATVLLLGALAGNAAANTTPPKPGEYEVCYEASAGLPYRCITGFDILKTRNEYVIAGTVSKGSITQVGIPVGSLLEFQEAPNEVVDCSYNVQHAHKGFAYRGTYLCHYYAEGIEPFGNVTMKKIGKLPKSM